MAKLEIKHLTKRFGKTMAVHALNLHVKDGELVVLLGPSGCGKTTTLRCVAGLETPDEGEVWIGDTLANKLPPKDRDVAMVFQTYTLYPHMMVYDNLAFPLKMRKMPKQQIDLKVKKIAEMLRIKELLDRKPAQLSGGQQQRVALGASIVREPKVFLMDEPLSNVDAKMRTQMRVEIKKLQQDLNITTLYVTHDQVEAMTMGDRVALMDGGVLHQYSTPSEIYSNPANTFVASFIGSPPMNLVNCSVIEREGLLILEFQNWSFTLEKNLAEMVCENAKGSELVVGIRPEDLKLHSHQERNRFKGKIYGFEFLGREFIVNVEAVGTILKVVTQDVSGFKVGDTAWVSFRTDKFRIFDKKSGVLVL